MKSSNFFHWINFKYDWINIRTIMPYLLCFSSSWSTWLCRLHPIENSMLTPEVGFVSSWSNRGIIVDQSPICRQKNSKGGLTNLFAGPAHDSDQLVPWLRTRPVLHQKVYWSSILMFMNYSLFTDHLILY